MELPGESCHYKLLDMHGEHISLIAESEARRLISLGYARTFGTVGRRSTKVVGVALTVALAVATGNPNSERSLMPSNYTGTRFVFRQKISTELANFYSFRHKKMHPSEDSNWALVRMLLPPALEGPVHRLKSEVECEAGIHAVGASPATWDGSKPFRALSAAARRASSPRPTRPTLARAA